MDRTIPLALIRSRIDVLVRPRERQNVEVTARIPRAARQPVLPAPVEAPQVARMQVPVVPVAPVVTVDRPAPPPVLTRPSPPPMSAKDSERARVVAEYEAWRRGGPRPTYSPNAYNQPYLYQLDADGSAYVLPDLDIPGSVPELLLPFYPLPLALRDHGLVDLRLVRPAWVQHKANPHLGECIKGELELESDG